MANLKRGAVTYTPFKGQAILADGLLAVDRPGGELERTIAASMFSAANAFGQEAERIARTRGIQAGERAALDALPGATISGGDMQAGEGPDLTSYLVEGKDRSHVDNLTPGFRGGLAQLLKDAPGKVQIRSGYRSEARQKELFDAAVKKYGSVEAARKWVAPPGKSHHNRGEAADLAYADDATKKWVHDNAKKYGLHFRLSNEDWHIEPMASGGGAPAPVTRSSAPQDAIGRAAARHGVPVGLLGKIAMLESGGRADARNPNSSAAGLFQQTDANAAQYGVKDRSDPYQSADGAARFMRDNIAYLTAKLGRAPTEGEIYLAHQQGAGGAVRLLKNPNAPAEAVVGADAVRLNGGKPGMTAGEFAGLWTARLGNAPAAPAFVGGSKRRSPLSIELSGGGLKLTGRDTIFGRAYDEAATATFRRALEDEMLDASAQLFDKYKDDPAELAVAFQDLKRAQLAEHVPDALRVDYELAFNRVQNKYLRDAQGAREKAIEKQDREAYDAESGRLGESWNRAQVGIDPDDENSQTVAAAEAARLKDHYREGVARGYLSQNQADDAIAEIDGGMATTFHVKQADGKTPDEIAAYHEQLREAYAAGELTGVDAKAWGNIDRKLGTLERSARAEGQRLTSQVNHMAASMVERAATGHEIAPEEIERFRTAAAGIDGGADIVKGTEQVLDIAKTLREAPVGEAEKQLAAIKTGYGKTPSPRQAAVMKTAEAMIVKSRQSLAKDLLGHAARAGVIADPGAVTDAANAGELAAFMQKRGELADQAAAHFGVSPRLFRPGEAAALEGLMKSDPVKGATLAGALISGAGPRARAMLKEFGKGAPVLAAAGVIMASGGDARAASDAIAGSAKDTNGKPYPSKGEPARKADAEAMTGAAFVFQAEDGARVTQAAEWIARKRMADAGVEHDSAEARDIHARAVNEAAGAVYDGDVQWGGFAAYDPGFWASEQRVLLPSTIRADRFPEVIEALRNEDFAVIPVGGVERLPELWPVLTASGYVFVDFDAEGGPVPIEGTDGKAFVLDFDALAPKLGPRVPGAIRGY
jgi:hypothetical protein